MNSDDDDQITWERADPVCPIRSSYYRGSQK